MAQKRSTFQLALLGFFGFFIIVSVFVFAGLSGGGSNQDVGEVTLWGTFDQSLMEAYLRALNDIDDRAGAIIYEEIPEREFQSRLVEALANGTGPDLFFMDQANILRHRGKVLPFGEDLITERTYKDTFIDEAELFLGSAQSGARGMPFSVDPLVLYWNRDIFAEAGFAKAPEFWDEMFTLAERITQRDNANNIQRATIALGEFDNISHAKDIIAALIMQAGGRIVDRLPDGTLFVALGSNEVGEQTVPAQSALRFYTEFADPVKNVYTWNRSLPNSQDAFAQGRLAMYVGYASEVTDIQAKNDNLNFDVALLPQIRAGEDKRTLTFGTLHSLAVPRVSDNVFGATTIALFLASKEPSELFFDFNGTPSPRRDVLQDTPSDPLDTIFYRSALLSRAWLDPQDTETDRIFRRMVGDVTSGALRLSDTIQRASQEIRALLDDA